MLASLKGMRDAKFPEPSHDNVSQFRRARSLVECVFVSMRFQKAFRPTSQ